MISTGEAVTFWILGPLALLGALGMVFARNAVHSALLLVMTMLSLGALYMAQQAPFLGFVQIIVYTGAVMMLFLFVLMLVGRDSSDSVVEVLRGQRLAALIFGIGFAVLLVGALGNAAHGLTSVGLAAGNAGSGGNVSRHRQADLHPVPVRVRAHLAPCSSRPRSGRWCWPTPSRAANRRRSASGPPSRPGCAASTTGSPRCPAPASSPRATRWPCPRSCPTARSPRSPSPAIIDATPIEESVPPEADAHALTGARTPRPLDDRGEGMSATNYLLLSALLFTIGAVGVLVRRNAIVVFMCVELMLNAVNLTLVTFSRINGALDGQVMAFFVMVVAAAEVVVGLAIIMSIFRTRRTASVDDANLLKY